MSNQFVRSMKNVVKGYSSTQVLVRNATANEGTGPNIDLLADIAEKTYDSADFFEIMDMLDKRLNDKGKYWKHIAKSLTVLDYLVRFGSENCVLWCKENLYLIKTLTEFRYEDENSGGVDQGQIIRVKAKELTALLMDDERLREERRLNNRRDRNRNRRPPARNGSDEDLQRALEESRRTAEEDERKRRLNQDDSDLQAALQLSKEEEELKRLQELQSSMHMQQQQPVYYDVFGNPISYEEYLQYQMQQDQLQKQQQNEWLLQQKQQDLLAQQQQQEMLLQQQQFLLAQQQQQASYLAQQQAMMQQQQQMPMQTGSNNPFALNNQQTNNNNVQAASELPDFTKPQAQSYQPAKLPEQIEIQQPVQQPVQQPLQQNRTGNKEMTNKYNELNQLLASGTGIDTFGNTGETRIPAQHTQTGTFINSQGTGYRQQSGESKVNPFLSNQYTGLPSSNIIPTQTGYGFGNQPQQQQYQQQQQQNNNQGVSLIDL
ncbi:hypothetical protein TPHA_0D04560 [Tetrapisispora phaffii CBS 4417]|uniref:ENTH domain-containing protein n=1 Tax=Tetrapisispora phaffii (strain ATCC 24235 / CBS 4417 / NBRC 1672 / NRRL Y-8282 / UCD 70-5) TaxID=1071381 RepID=G8BS15_TETPH|nr:hypothetical protein TPHA_0D04560 [Tetrapisispora phaffii CBS 4417]CCE63090.1 hypothetical protein TPHA_0D04560 [Tetrapisispora phaffii CBS 4417]